MPNIAALTSLGLGIALCALHAWIMWRPQEALPAFRRFPRTVWPGRILAAVCMLWFARNLWQVDLGGFNSLKNILYVAAPTGIYLVVVFLPDLLSVRALFAFFLLAAQPALVAVRWSGTPASWAVGLFVYALIVKSMILIVYPHLWIRSLDRWEARPEVRKPFLAVGVLMGLALVACGAVSFESTGV